MGNQATKMRNGRIDGKNRWSTRTTMEELWRCKILGLALSHSSFFQRCRNPPSSKPLHSSFFQRCLSSLSDLTPATHRHQSANSGQQSGAGRQKFTGNDDAQVKGARSGTALNIDSERKIGNAALINGCR
ncbi:hypothetical protein QL285_020674 [Trifolium repens]|nr:hypothetical protein QL285_020674 [Trifolium repens]